jgi:hypothetical protein
MQKKYNKFITTHNSFQNNIINQPNSKSSVSRKTNHQPITKLLQISLNHQPIKYINQPKYQQKTKYDKNLHEIL